MTNRETAARNMSERTLDAFLAAGLLNELKGEDTWYGKIAAAADALSLELQATPSKLVPFLYCALNREAKADDAGVAAARSVLQAQWKAYASAFPETPVTIMRAILLDAVVTMTARDVDSANAAALLIASAAPNLDLGREAPVWQATFKTLTDKVQQRAEEMWSVPSRIAIEPPDLSALEAVNLAVVFNEVNLGALEADFFAAAGPTDAKNVATNGNPQWPNSFEPWSKAFAPLAAKAVKKAIDDVVSIEEDQLGLKEFSEALSSTIGDYVNGAVAKVAEAAQGVDLRSRLLWWRQASYSSSATSSYRKMNVLEVPALMAFDYQAPLPAIAPASVSAFLEEAVHDFLGEAAAAEATPLGVWIATIRGSAHAATLRAKLATLRFSDGRKPLIAVLNDSREPNVAITAMTVYSPQHKVAPVEFARLVFLELQAVKAASTLEARNAPKAGS